MSRKWTQITSKLTQAKKRKLQFYREWINEKQHLTYTIPAAEPCRPKILREIYSRSIHYSCTKEYYEITDRDFWNFKRIGMKHFMRLLYDDLNELKEFVCSSELQKVKIPLEIKGMLVIRMSTRQNARIPLTASKWQEELVKKEIPYIYTKNKHDGVIWNGPWGYVP